MNLNRTLFLLGVWVGCCAVAFSQPAPKENLQRLIGTNTIAGTQAGAPFKVETIAALKSIAAAARFEGQQVELSGYYVAGDGGGGVFQFSASSASSDNGGTVIAPTSGTGRWLRINAPAINVRWFGAKGDDSADDTSALQAAITAGTNIYLPSGTYKITSALDLRVGQKNFYGNNRDTTIIKQYTNNTQVLKVGGSSNYYADFTVTWNSYQGISSTTAVGFEIYALDWSTIERVQVNRSNVGFSVKQAAVILGANWIFSCSLRDIIVNGYSKYGMYLQAYSGGISGNVLSNIYLVAKDANGVALNTAEAFYLGGWSDGVISQLNIEGSNPTQGIYLNTCLSLVFNAVHFETVKPTTNFGAFVDASYGTHTFNDFSITGSTINVADALYIFRASGPNTKFVVHGLIETGNTVTTSTFRMFTFGDETGCLAYAFSANYSGLTGVGFSSSTPSVIRVVNGTTGGINNNDVFQLAGTGSPEGAVTAPKGSTYQRADGGAGTSFYVKESGTGNTGWVGK